MYHFNFQSTYLDRLRRLFQLIEKFTNFSIHFISLIYQFQTLFFIQSLPKRLPKTVSHFNSSKRSNYRGKVRSRGSIISRPSQLEPDIPVSVYPAPDSLRLPFCWCGYIGDRIDVLPSNCWVSSYCGCHQCGGGVYLRYL